jgi:uncharacterized membrane protein (DUF485 family)
MKEQIFDTLSKLVEVNLQLFKIEIKQEIADLIVKLSILLVMLIFANIIIVLGSFAMAFLLGELLGKPLYGFGIITLVYAIILGIVWVQRKSIEATIRQKVRQAILAKNAVKELPQAN